MIIVLTVSLILSIIVIFLALALCKAAGKADEYLEHNDLIQNENIKK